MLLDSHWIPMGIESYHSPPGLQWESSSPPDSSGNTRERVKYSPEHACSCQQQTWKASQMLTYILFKTQSMLLSTTNREGQPDADLQPVQNPEHALVNNKQGRPARC